MIDIAWRKQVPSHYDQLSSDEDDFELNEGDGFNWEKGEDPTEPISDYESGEIHPTSTVRTSSSSRRRMVTDEILPQSMNYSPSEDEIGTLSPENSVHLSYAVTLELSPSEHVSPLGDNSTTTFFTGKLPSLEPPLNTPPSVRRTGGSTNRGQKRSSGRKKSLDQSDRVQENQDAKPGQHAFLNLKPRRHAFMIKPSSGRTVRRRSSLDCTLQKTAMIQSLDQSDRVATKPGRRGSLDLKPRRRRSMDFSYHSDHNNLSGRTRTDTGVFVAPINDDSNHSRTRIGAEKLQRNQRIVAEKLQRNQESFGSLSSCGEKSKLLSPPWSGVERLQRKQRLSSFGSLSKSDHGKSNRTMRRGSLSNNSEKSNRTKPTRRRRSMDFSYCTDNNNLSGRTRTDSGVIMAPINGDSNHSGTLLSPTWSGEEKLQRKQRMASRSISRSRRRNQRNSNSEVEYLQMQFTSVEGTNGCCVIKRRSRSIERSRTFDLNKTSKRTRSTESGERFLEARKLAQTENQERLEGKLANQRELKPSSSLRKQKTNEISAIYNQVDARHRRRYSRSPKRFDDGSDEDE